MQDTSGLLCTYDKFMAIPITMYRTAGINLKNLKESRSFWLALNFWGGMVNLNFVVLAGIMFIYHNIGNFSSFLEVSAIAPCLGFGFIANFKAYVIAHNARSVMKVQHTLKDIFPATKQDQQHFRVAFYRKRVTLIMSGFIATYLTLIVVFTLSMIVQSIVETYVYGEEFVKRIPFFGLYPLNMDRMGVYLFIYVHQIYSAHSSVIITISADIFMCCVVMQLVMHFDTLGDGLREFVPTGMSSDILFLKAAIRRHQIALGLCEQLNNIFSPSILFNFLASSMIICLVGFQVTAGVTLLEFCKYMLFLFSSLLQIFLICYFGTMLIDSSGSVARASYENQWYIADRAYKKMILMVIMRAQKTAGLKVVTFDDVSLRSFNTVCSLAYQFFALLRSVYGKI